MRWSWHAVMVSSGALAMDGGSSKSPLQNSFLEWGNEERVPYNGFLTIQLLSN